MIKQFLDDLGTFVGAMFLIFLIVGGVFVFPVWLVVQIINHFQ